MLKKDNLILGFVLGLIAPLFGMLAFYFWKFYPAYSLKDFFTVLLLQTTLITGIVSFSLFTNVAILTYYVNTKRDKAVIGIFIVTCIYVLAALIIKWTA